MPMLLGKKTILVGDHRQLPPMFRERDASFSEATESHEITSEDLNRYRGLVTASLFQELFEKAPDSIKATLWDQYRMPPAVMDAVNQFYEGKLQAGGGRAALGQKRQHRLEIQDARGGSLIEPSQSLLWVDSSRDARGEPCWEEQRGSSKINRLEVLLIGAFLQRLGEQMARQKNPPAGPLSVGVITFYGAQLGELNAEIHRRSRQHRKAFEALDLRLNTVDRFQGMEKAIVLVSLVRSMKGKPGAFVREYQRVNVGFSRAQQLLAIFGAEETWKHVQVPLPTMAGGTEIDTPVYKNILDFARKNGGRRDASQLIP
jgi:superfamily I DNA and/or RNA helicase